MTTATTPAKRKGRPRKPPNLTLKKVPFETDTPESKFLYKGMQLIAKIPEYDKTHRTIIAKAVEQFETRYDCNLQYMPKFKAFKILRDLKHVDWIEMNTLRDQYKLAIPQLSTKHPKAQRPYKENRIY